MKTTEKEKSEFEKRIEEIEKISTSIDQKLDNLKKLLQDIKAIEKNSFQGIY